MKAFMTFVESRSGVQDGISERYLARFLGVKDAKDAALDALSPAKHVTKDMPPVLLIHGRDDTVVPFEQTRLMAEAIKKVGGPSELVTLKDEDHWLSRGPTRIQMLQATVGFLEKIVPPIDPRR